MKIKRNIILGVIVCLIIGSVLLLKPIIPTQAAIDAPRGVVVEKGDSQYDFEIWWISPNYTGLDYINVYLSVLPLENFSVITTQNDVTSNQPNNVQIKNLDTSLWYYIYLTAVDTQGNESGPTSTLKRRLGTSADVTSPVDITNVSMQTNSSTSLTMSWINPPEDDFYRVAIYRSQLSVVDDSDANFINYQIGLPLESGNFTDTNLESATTYYYRLVSEDVKGNKSESIIISGTTLSLLPEPDSEPEPSDEEQVDVPESPSSAPSNIPPAYLFDYQASFIGQNGTIGAGDDGILTHIVQADRGSTIDMWIQFKNTSTYQWWFENPLDLDNIHEVRLGLTKDVDSPFTHSSWISTNRLTKISENIFPNQVATLNFKLFVPENIAPGAYKLSVGLVAEWIKWIYDDVHWEIQIG